MLYTNTMKQYREEKEPYMSQWALANKVGVCQTMIVNWERGYTKPSNKHKQSVAKALGISMVDLFPKENVF